ncbi:hypothetical protein DFH27DRAFT_562814 [Peziza echinospora]|nr:hypothetical protein DFH27DRAFT_562814 [Peziza echinospora]
MPIDFGKECPYNIYLSGERTSVHFGDGSLLYTIQLLKSHARGTGVSTKLLKNANGETKYIITQVRNKEDVYEAPMYYVSAFVDGSSGNAAAAASGSGSASPVTETTSAVGGNGDGSAAVSPPPPPSPPPITTTKNTATTTITPTPITSTTTTTSTGSKGNPFPTRHGTVGRVFQQGYEICVSFRLKDSRRERERMLSISSIGGEELKELPGRPSISGPELAPTKSITSNHTLSDFDDDDDSDEEEKVHREVHEPSGGGTSEDATTAAAGPASKVMKFFASLLPKGNASSSSSAGKPPKRFVGLVYDGRGRWVYLASRAPGLHHPHHHHLHPASSGGGGEAAQPPVPHDIILAHKDAEDSQKGFLGLRPVVMERGNEWLRDLLVATWVTVLWEEERWGRLPGQLRNKGLEYLGGVTGGE